MKKLLALALAMFLAAMSMPALAEPVVYSCDAYSIAIPDGWNIATPEELTGYVAAAEDDVKEVIDTDEAASLYDMMMAASSADGLTSLVILYEPADGRTAAQIMEGVLADYAAMFADTASFGELKTTQLGDLEHSYLSYSMYGLSIAQYCAVAGENAFMFTFTGMEEAAIAEILANFVPAV